MTHGNKTLFVSGVVQFAIALGQGALSFSPSLSLYFGAPEALVNNTVALVGVSFFVAGLLALFGLYALSGAGTIRRLPFLRPVLVLIGGIYILRGLVIVPELLMIAGVVQASIPIDPRFIVFSAGSLLMGGFFIAGTIGDWAGLHPNSSPTTA